MMNFDPYEALGVTKDTSQDDIKKSYRKLARKYHPDVNPGDKKAEDKFKQISEAYDILGDAKKREEFDRLGQKGFYDNAFDGKGYERPDFGAGFNFEDLFGDLFRGQARAEAGGGRGGGFDFRTAFGGGGFQDYSAGPRRGQDLTFRMSIGFREAVFGTETTLEFNKPVPCETCRGGGVNPSSGQACASCGGRGQTVVHERIKARIPAGVDSGRKVRLAGKGSPGPGGGPAGDLYLEIEVEPDPVFQRQGQDILVETSVNLFEAVLGDKIEVPTLTGRAALKIPAGTQNNAKFRLKGQGVKGGKKKPDGDLYVLVKVLIPKGLSSEARDMFEQLRQMVPMDAESHGG
ncbi:MAG: DnaJ C-terminal domain-containing protein [Pseudomonadota bacterium]